MQITITGLVLVLGGDAALVAGALGVAGVVQLSSVVAIALIVVGAALNLFGVLSMRRAARARQGEFL